MKRQVPPRAEYNYRRASAKTNVPTRTIQHYTSSELIEPSIQRGEGRGSSTLYSRGDLAEIIVIRNLAAFLLLTKVRKIMEVVRKTHEWRAWIADADPEKHCMAKLIVYHPKRIEFSIRLVDQREVDFDFGDIGHAVVVNVGLALRRAFSED